MMRSAGVAGVWRCYDRGVTCHVYIFKIRHVSAILLSRFVAVGRQRSQRMIPGVERSAVVSARCWGVGYGGNCLIK